MSDGPLQASPTLHHLALRVADIERARRFYADLLGLPVIHEQHDQGGPPRAVWLSAGPVVVMLERQLRGRGAETGSGHLLALGVDHLEAWEERLRAAGVAVVDRTPATLYVSDPDGHRVGLSVHRFESPEP